MKSRHLLLASTVIAAALISGCDGGTSGPTTGPILTIPSTPPSVSEFIASLIALVSGNSCDTALPAALDGLVLTDDSAAVDANTLAVNCPS